jgi:signal peptidase I
MRPLRLLPGNADLPPRVVYPFRTPRRGDVVVFEYPRDMSKDYIKRVIALPGETVEIREGRVYINGALLDEPYLQGITTTLSPGRPVCARSHRGRSRHGVRHGGQPRQQQRLARVEQLAAGSDHRAGVGFVLAA